MFFAVDVVERGSESFGAFFGHWVAFAEHGDDFVVEADSEFVVIDDGVCDSSERRGGSCCRCFPCEHGA